MVEPPKPPVIPPAQPGSVTCAACGWPNPKGAVKCEFCTTPFVRAEPKPPPAEILCPHCEATFFERPGSRRCPECGRGLAEPPSAAKKVLAKGIRLLRSVRISSHAFVFGVIVFTGLMGFCMNMRLQNASATKDHMHQIKQMVQIYQGENGTYPASLDDLAQRYGPVPEHVKVDGWGNAIMYQALDPQQPYGGAQPVIVEPGMPTTYYRRCELRSAGPNKVFGDDDDVVWEGKAD